MKTKKIKLESIKSSDGWAELAFSLKFDSFKNQHKHLDEDEVANKFDEEVISNYFKYGEYADLEIEFDENLNIVGGRILNKYKEIDFGFGSVDSAVKELKSHNELVCGSFNGKMLYSDIDDLDSAYKKIVGKTKAECDEEKRIWHEEYEEQQRKHKEAIPELTKEWTEKGKTILDEKYHELWAKCVPIRLEDLYQGMELKMCLDIILELNNNCTLDEAKTMIDGQNHSGASFGLVCSLVKSFCDRGDEFFNYVK